MTETLPGEFPEQFYQDPTGIDRYIVQEKVWESWHTPNRVHPPLSNTTFRRGAGVVLIITALCFVFGEWIAPLVLWAGGFLFYLLIKQPALEQHIKITTLGVKFDDHYFYWSQLSQFWFEERDGISYLYFRQVFPNVGLQRTIISPAINQQQLKTTVGKYILYKVPDFSYIERWWREFVQHLPIDVGA